MDDPEVAPIPEAADLAGYSDYLQPSASRFKILALAAAINQAENSGDPNGGRRNNPGNLTNESGCVVSFPNAIAGWDALEKRLYEDFILGKSKLYSAKMNFRELAWMWVTGGAPGQVKPHARDNPENWAAIVAGKLGISVTSTVGAFLG